MSKAKMLGMPSRPVRDRVRNREAARRSYHMHREEHLARKKQYQKEHREELNAYSREYRKRRKENSDQGRSAEVDADAGTAERRC